MAGRIACSVFLLLSVAARAGAQPPDPPKREAGERARPAKSSVTARRAMLYHLAEGSEIFPLDWLIALKSAKTGKPFLDDLERFGLIPDPEPVKIPGYEDVKLPIGVTVRTPKDVLGVIATLKPAPGHLETIARPMDGVNCAACHVGRLRYRNKDLPIIDGAPNLFNIDSFYQEVFVSVLKTVRETDKRKAFLSELEKLGPRTEISRILVSSFADLMKNPPQLGGAPGKAIVGWIRRIFAAQFGAKADTPQAKKAYDLLANRVDFLVTLASLHKGGEQVTIPGPGRIDAFGNVRRLVFTNAPKVPVNAPVDFPPLWRVSELEWFHWDGNTNSLMQRNIGQAMGLGAIADLETGASTILPLNIHALESLFSRLNPPEWPEDHFGVVDTASERYRKGAALYVQHCAQCHDRQEGAQTSPEGGITYPLKEIGTDCLRAVNFESPLQGGKEFTDGMRDVAETVKNHALIGAQLADVRGRLDLPKNQIRWLTTKGYVARPLEGVWATAPYLHNGSVPTLDDLLKPENERPVCFPVGHREYDPVKLGYVSECDKVLEAEKSRYFIYDTRLPGNSNRGHNYGTDLDSCDRAALLEYLKVMDHPDMLAAYGSSHAPIQKEPDHRGPEVARPEPSGLGMENVPPGEANDILKLKELQLELMKFDALIGNVKPVERGQHPKHHGFVVARFTVDGNIADELRVGLFREPKTYRAVIRFSNTKERDDRMPDNHGMAIKVFAVSPPDGRAEPKDQDFVLLDHPQFFTPNVASLLAFSQKKKSLVLEKHLTGKALLEELNLSFPKEVGLLEGRKQRLRTPLEAEYFSTTPYRFGETAVKYRANPEQSPDQFKDYLRDVLVEQLSPHERPASVRAPRWPAVRFGLHVQRQTDPAAMPIEDPTVVWNSPWEKVATIEIDPQEFDFSERREWGNKLSFSPWHALDEHRPLGGINRARKDVYPASFNLRTQSLVEEAAIPMKKSVGARSEE